MNLTNFQGHWSAYKVWADMGRGLATGRPGWYARRGFYDWAVALSYNHLLGALRK